MEDKRANARTQTRGWLFFGKLVAALGGPALGSLGLSTWAKNHKFLAVFLVVLYEAAVFSIGLLSEIWNRLKEKWLAAIAQRIDYQVQGLVSGYRRKYLEHVFYECRNFDVKGLSTQGTYALELQRVFVELSVDAQPLHEVSRNPIPSLPPRLQQGRHDIWEFLNAGHNLALLGSPGSGKTTLLRHIALVLALAHKSSGAKLKPSRIPIVLFLRSHGKDVAANSDISLAAIVGRSDIVKEMHDPPPNEWFERQLAQGRCLVLLDGLYEVADRLQRLKLVQWLEGQIKSYGKNLFLVTSRPYGYRENPLGSVHTLSVRPFSRGQVQRFVENWYLANEIVSHNYNDPGVRKEAEKGTRDLMRRINGSEVLTELAVNPLLLTMIATVHKYRSELPGRRVELYREICEVFLGKRQDVRGVERVIDLTPSQKQCVLEPLAYHMMMMRTREIDANAAASLIKEALLRVSPSTAPEDFLRVIEDTSGVVLERESGEFAFAHKTFQEYLASVHCRRQHLETDLANTVKDNWWHETIRLYVAQGDATQILLACLQDNVPTSEAIVLAVECLEEAQQVDRDCRQRLETILANEAEDESRQRVYGESLLRLRLKRMVSLDEKCWVDTKLVTQAEYQVFVDERRAKKFARQPDSWYSTHFAPGQGGTPIIGIRASDAADFVRWLGEKDETWLYRLPGERELAGERLRLAHSRTELNQSGCWSTTSGGENRLIASLEPRRRDQFLEGFWRFAEKLWTEDLRAVSALLNDRSDSDK